MVVIKRYQKGVKEERDIKVCESDTNKPGSFTVASHPPFEADSEYSNWGDIVNEHANNEKSVMHTRVHIGDLNLGLFGDKNTIEVPYYAMENGHKVPGTGKDTLLVSRFKRHNTDSTPDEAKKIQVCSFQIKTQDKKKGGLHKLVQEDSPIPQFPVRDDKAWGTQ